MKTKVTLAVLILVGAIVSKNLGRDPDNGLAAIAQRRDQCMEIANDVYQQCLTEKDAADYPQIYVVCQLTHDRRTQICIDQYNWEINAYYRNRNGGR
jgi:hypothetical protein